MLDCKVKAYGRFDGALAIYPRFFPLGAFSALPSAPTTKQKLNFTFDLATYFLFLVRGLVSYQDEGKVPGWRVGRPRPSGLPDKRILRKMLQTPLKMSVFYSFIYLFIIENV